MAEGLPSVEAGTLEAHLEDSPPDHQGSKHYGRLHDTLLFYSGGSADYTWNQQYVPLDQSYIASHYSQKDEQGRPFQWGDLRAPGGAAPSKGNPHYKVLGVDGYWRYTQEKMEQFIREGRVAIPPGGTVPRYRRYLDESKGLAREGLNGFVAWLAALPMIYLRN